MSTLLHRTMCEVLNCAFPLHQSLWEWGSGLLYYISSVGDATESRGGKGLEKQAGPGDLFGSCPKVL